MNKLWVIGCMAFFLYQQAAAQDVQNVKKEITYFKQKVGQPPDTTLGWKRGVLLNISLSQGTLQNWAAGGDNFSLSLNGSANLFANYHKRKTRWDNSLVMAYGLLKSTSLGLRKTDDNFNFTSKYGYQFSGKWYAGVLLDLRTQFANGYIYPDDSTIVSHIFSPAYGLVALGFNYQSVDYFSIFLSPLTSRFTIVADQRLANQGAYGVDSAKYEYYQDGSKTLIRAGRKLAYQLGSYASAQFNKEVMKNINLTSRLDLFSNFLEAPQNIKIYWTALIAMKVNKLVTVTLNTELIYDDDIRIWQNKNGVYGPRTQFKELLGVGFAYKL